MTKTWHNIFNLKNWQNLIHQLWLLILVEIEVIKKKILLNSSKLKRSYTLGIFNNFSDFCYLKFYLCSNCPQIICCSNSLHLLITHPNNSFQCNTLKPTQRYNKVQKGYNNLSLESFQFKILIWTTYYVYYLCTIKYQINYQQSICIYEWNK